MAEETRLQNAIEENSKVTADFQKMADRLQEQLDAEKQKSQVNYEFREIKNKKKIVNFQFFSVFVYFSRIL